jgi:predicted  nucleic acid-binding Zn-ribbon protein
MMDTLLSEWKEALQDLQDSVSKDLEEIRRQKAEVQQIKTDIFNRLAEGQYLRDEKRIVISAPEIIIGDVDKSGALWNSGGAVVVRGNNVSLQGAGESGRVDTRATQISQIAVDPGSDGVEEVVWPHSQVVNQARHIVLQSNDSLDYFSEDPTSGGAGVRIHADDSIEISATQSVESRGKIISDKLSALKSAKSDLNSEASKKISQVNSIISDVEDILDSESDLNENEMDVRTNLVDLMDLQDQFSGLIPALYGAVKNCIETLSSLAETNRRITALEAEQTKVDDAKSDFKDKTTGARLTVQAEQMNFSSVDGDGNIRTNDESAIRMQAKHLAVTTLNSDGTLIEDSDIVMRTQSVGVSTANTQMTDEKNGSITSGGSVIVQTKDFSLSAVDYDIKDGELEEKDQAAESSVNIRTENIALTSHDKDGNTTGTFFVNAADTKFSSADKDKNTTGTFGVQVNNMALSSYDKDKNATGQFTLVTELASVAAIDKDGKAKGQISLDAKDIYVKATDVDAEKLTDKNMAAGSSLTLLAEKMYVGRMDADNQAKELTLSSEETGVYGKTTAEMQQGEAKAVVQLTGGNVAVSGSKAEFYGDNTVNGKTTFKGEITAPKAAIDSLQAKSEFKSPNIKDGMPAAPAAGGGSLSAKLKEADAPKAKDVELPKDEEEEEGEQSPE